MKNANCRVQIKMLLVDEVSYFKIKDSELMRQTDGKFGVLSNVCKFLSLHVNQCKEMCRCCVHVNHFPLLPEITLSHSSDCRVCHSILIVLYLSVSTSAKI